jgi:large subunit ribosomal protein L4
LWRHGGTVHGPQPRSYEYQFPRKKLFGALRSALSSKLAAGKLLVVDSFDAAEVKTKLYRQALDRFDAKKTVLLVESSQRLSEKVYLGTRNLAGVELVLSSEVHPYDLLRYEYAIFSQAALEALQETLAKNLPKSKSVGTETAKEAA